jgi:hypothetical protein
VNRSRKSPPRLFHPRQASIGVLQAMLNRRPAHDGSPAVLGPVARVELFCAECGGAVEVELARERFEAIAVEPGACLFAAVRAACAFPPGHDRHPDRRRPHANKEAPP